MRSSTNCVTVSFFRMNNIMSSAYEATSIVIRLSNHFQTSVPRKPYMTLPHLRHHFKSKISVGSFWFLLCSLES